MIRLGVVSDLHALSQYGLVPPDWWSQKHPTRALYQHLWRCWEHFCEACPPLDVLLVNGEAIEGETPTSRAAREAITDDLEQQADAAVVALRPLRQKASRLYVVRGTPFHEGKHAQAAERVARELDAERFPSGYATSHVLDTMVGSLRMNAAHHMTRGWQWLAGGADRTAAMARLAEATGKLPRADLIVRSHLHRLVIAYVHGVWVLFTPAWKVVTPHAEQVMEYTRASALSDIGSVVAEIHEDGTIRWRPYTYVLYRQAPRSPRRRATS
jgi:hypothetical protein